MKPGVHTWRVQLLSLTACSTRHQGAAHRRRSSG
jgi:hypothetical protein